MKAKPIRIVLLCLVCLLVLAAAALVAVHRLVEQCAGG